MSKIIKFAKLVRRNWKKSTLLFGLFSYGVSFGVERYQAFQMMRAYCEEARSLGEKTLPRFSRPKHITVILNPEANNKKSLVQFEKFASPLLHLAGFKVSVIQTEKKDQACELMEIMANTDAVIVAGGDGTFQEAVTGWMHRPNVENEHLPMGVIPLGKTNSLANYLFGSKSLTRAQLVAEAAMAVIRETVVPLDIMKIQFGEEKQPVYAMCNFEEGVFGDIEPLVEKYWYLGFFKDKYLYLKNAFKQCKMTENASFQYVEPCSGCSKCYVSPKVTRDGRWWSVFVPQKQVVHESGPDRSKIINEKCGTRISLNPSYLNLSIFTKTMDQEKKISGSPLYLKVYPEALSFKEFMVSGLNHRKSKVHSSSQIPNLEAREIYIERIESESEESSVQEFSYLDNEKYPRASCKISVVPKQIMMFG